ncbi:MAG: alpha-1,2-fucosyltransferase [Lachnospiraceae bacterium]|jgi:hypothetical protein|nr:alpha-1,2-fucosyltransferase [Lachnospiraceae bacterium]
MIRVNVTGGLGNQIFCYCCARALQEETGQEIELNTWELNRYESFREFSLSDFRLKEPVRISDSELPWYAHRRSLRGALLRRISPELMKSSGIRHNSHIWYQLSYTEFPAPDPEKDICLGGYWQSEKYFSGCLPALRSELQLTDAARDAFPKDAAALERQILDSRSVCIHVRRGDYMKLGYGVCGTAYYREAMRRMEENAEDITYFVFSDDPAWARENIVPGRTTVYAAVHRPSCDLYLMSRCHDFILANSSFSWWAQELNPCSGRRVIAPAKWHTKLAVRDIWKEDWEKIDV